MTTRQSTIDPQSSNLLEEVQTMTRVIRDHQDQIIRLSHARRDQVLALRAKRIKYREIAEAIGASETTVYKIIRGDI